jgi:hypothetical protein
MLLSYLSQQWLEYVVRAILAISMHAGQTCGRVLEQAVKQSGGPNKVSSTDHGTCSEQ